MKNEVIIKNLLENKKIFDKKIKKLSGREIKKLEKKWDVESAYYSNNLEGSKVPRATFDTLSKKIK